MKRVLSFFLLILLVLIGLSYCVKEEPPKMDLPISNKVIYEEEDFLEISNQNEEGDSLGNSNPDSYVGPPSTVVVIIDTVVEITSTTAIVIGREANPCEELIVIEGICYSMAPDPIAYKDDPYILGGLYSDGNVTFTLSNLTSNTLYYARMFAAVWTWEHGEIVYGNEVAFRTKP